MTRRRLRRLWIRKVLRQESIGWPQTGTRPSMRRYRLWRRWARMAREPL